MPDETFPIPVEIPWQLLKTNYVFSPDKGPEHDTTAISVFTYFPKLRNLELDYPDDRLVYLKFTASVSPYSTTGTFFQTAFSPKDIMLEFLTVGNPIWRLILDVSITVPGAQEVGQKPFFIAASPIRRAMLETGIVGSQTFEGESNSHAVGKSGSQLYESSGSPEVRTSGWGLDFGVFGYSSTSTETKGRSTHDVKQFVDTTQRNASEERRELFSHMTNVKNLLTLLRTTLVGSPFLRFDLMPPPLRPLTLDPSGLESLVRGASAAAFKRH